MLFLGRGFRTPSFSLCDQEKKVEVGTQAAPGSPSRLSWIELSKYSLQAVTICHLPLSLLLGRERRGGKRGSLGSILKASFKETNF
jgi:hypothetical protein